MTQSQQPVGSIKLTADEVSVLLVYLIRFPDLLRRVSELIQREHFIAPQETPHMLLFVSLQDMLAAGESVGYHAVLNRFNAVCREAEGMISPEQYYSIAATPSGAHSGGLLYTAFWLPSEQLDYNYGVNLSQDFLRQRAVLSTLVEVSAGASTEDPFLSGDIRSMVDAVTSQLRQIDSLSPARFVTVAPERGSNLPTPTNYKTTGCAFLDRLLLGQRDGDVNIILGVTGAGKSTLCSQMAVGLAANSVTNAQPGQPIPQVLFFGYEESAQLVLPNIYSSAFRIARDKLINLTDWSQLSHAGALEPYESGSEFAGLGERERWDAGRRWLSASLRYYDMSGSDEFPDAGCGGADEIIACVADASRSSPIAGVFVDYAGLVCKRFMARNRKDPDKIRYYLSALPDTLRNNIARQFNTTVWLAHQLTGAAASFSPAKLVTHADSAECKTIAENAAVALCLGVVDKATGCRIMNPSKVRYRPPDLCQPLLLRSHDHFAKLEDVSSQYVLDSAGRRIVSRQEQSVVVDGSARPSGQYGARRQRRISPLIEGLGGQ